MLKNPKSILLKNGSVFRNGGFERADILIKNGIIEKIAESINAEADYRFNAENMTVSHGLTDFHTHIKGISADSIGIEPEKISHSFGVTHLVDASAEQGSRQAALSDSTDISVLALAYTDGNKADFSNVERMLKLYGNKVIGLKVYLDSTFTEITDTAPLAEICDFASENGLFVMAHTTNSPMSMREIAETMNRGDVISHAFHGGMSSAAEDDFECLRLAKEKGVLLDAAYSAYYHVDYSLLSRAAGLGIYPDILSTDITRELESFGGKKYSITTVMNIAACCGIDESRIFKAVTENPYKLLKKSGCGYIKEGEAADLAVFENIKSDFKAADRFGNTVTSDTERRCVLTVYSNRLTVNADTVG